jgi:hypothetical protein
MSAAMNAVKKLELTICQQDFDVNGKLHLAIRQSEVADRLRRLKAEILNLHLEEVDKLEKTEGFELKYLYTK